MTEIKAQFIIRNDYSTEGERDGRKRNYFGKKIKPVEQVLSAKEGLAQMFRQCFMNTLDTTWQNEEDGTSFVITGDIPAMWLRDSTAQVMHYVRFAGEKAVRDMLRGLIRRQLDYVLKDPYANSFNRTDSGAGFGEEFGRGLWRGSAAPLALGLGAQV